MILRPVNCRKNLHRLAKIFKQIQSSLIVVGLHSTHMLPKICSAYCQTVLNWMWLVYPAHLRAIPLCYIHPSGILATVVWVGRNRTDIDQQLVTSYIYYYREFDERLRQILTLSSATCVKLTWQNWTDIQSIQNSSVLYLVGLYII